MPSHVWGGHSLYQDNAITLFNNDIYRGNRVFKVHKSMHHRSKIFVFTGKPSQLKPVSKFPHTIPVRASDKTTQDFI